ncbi:AAA ATPase-like domain-containing protein [Candidatus Magnetomoraceae bacterium gMMP-15]
MRKFSSYGPINTKLHYYAPRKELINRAVNQLVGEYPEEGGHYITVWAPRQTGKTWVMLEVVKQIKAQGDFEVGIISLQSAKTKDTDQGVLEIFVRKIKEFLKKDLPAVNSWDRLNEIFRYEYFDKPLILIIDEFDALDEDFINKFANEFREMYIDRQNETDKKSSEKRCLLHGLALIGVRSVLGIENVKGSPFNVQRSLKIPNLTFDEVDYIYKWYEKESNQKINQEVIDKIYYEFRGQPGLTCWFGEILTEEEYNKETDKPIKIRNFEIVHAAAISVLPNNNILNIVSKARQEPYRKVLLELFKTEKKIKFSYDNIDLNYLYMNGVIDIETKNQTKYFARFSSPFVQTRLFGYFSDDLFSYTGQLVEPFKSLDNVITDESINIKNLMRLYETYLKKNKNWLLEDAPRRKDMRIFEAVYHFNLYMYLYNFLTPQKAKVWPEFPTGNGKIDIIINYAGQIYGIELKSYTNEKAYTEAIKQAADYAVQLKIKKISLVFFVEYIDDQNREKYEINDIDEKTGIKVEIVFVGTGE